MTDGSHKSSQRFHTQDFDHIILYRKCVEIIDEIRQLDHSSVPLCHFILLCTILPSSERYMPVVTGNINVLYQKITYQW